MKIEVFTRWAADTQPWQGYGVATCPHCVRAHRFADPVDGETATPINGCLPSQDGFTVVVRTEPMNLYRKPLRTADDPGDPSTPWVRCLPPTDEPPF